MFLEELTIKQAHLGLVNKDFSAVELTQAYLDQINKTDQELQAFITVIKEQSLAQATQVDKKIQHGDNIHLLAGIPYAAKDIYSTYGVKTTAGSKILENFIPAYESTTTQRLSNVDSILIGKTNLDEFAMGSSTENSAFFTTKNPIDNSRVPGGSSGGSATAVKANQSLYALGTDTGGSIRQPASFCGVVGLKPTYGRTSRYGVMAFASSLDTIGHFTKTVEDSAIVLSTIAGQDIHDSTSAKLELSNYLASLKQDIKGLRIGIPKQYFNHAGLDKKVKQLILKLVKQLEKLSGIAVKEIDLPHTKYALSCYYIIMPAEASSNLARYDSIRYGLSKDTAGLLGSYIDTRSVGFGDEVKRRIILGTFTLSHGYYDAYYKKALQVRTLIKRDFEDAFKDIDILVSPVTPTTAFKIGEKIDDPIQMYLSDIFTIPASLSGLPAISLPAGVIDGLPIGMQIIGRPFEEATILKAAYHCERLNHN